jgi:hypothetical protein
VRILLYRLSSLVLVAGLTLFSPTVSAQDKGASPASKDEIEVVGHIPLMEGPVTRFLSTHGVALFGETNS